MYEADALFNQIMMGKENAVPRPSNQSVDRALRKRIEEAQKNGRVIINDDDKVGYYEPDWSDEVQVLAYRHYINKQKSRIKAHADAIWAMERTAAAAMSGQESFL